MVHSMSVYRPQIGIPVLPSAVWELTCLQNLFRWERFGNNLTIYTGDAPIKTSAVTKDPKIQAHTNVFKTDKIRAQYYVHI